MNLLPFPETEEEVAAAHARFKARVNTGKPNYYYIKKDGDIIYYEHKGTDKQGNRVIGTRNKAKKASNNWGREARLKDVTPELKDFEEALGDKKLAKKAFKEMGSDMNLLQKNLAKLNASQQRGFALDHFDPVAKKGLNVPWYLRIMESGPNSAKGAKMPLTPDQLARMGFFKNKVHAIKARYLGVESIQGSLGGSGIDLNWDDMDEVFEYASSGKNSKQVDKYIDDVFKRRTIAIREGGEAIRKRHNIKPVSDKRYGTPDKVRAIANRVGQRAYKTGSYRVGGMLKATTGLSRGESLLRIIGGDYVGGSLGLAMTTPTFQKKAAALLAKQGIKLIPGVSLGSGALQAAGYVAKGQFTKAGLSAIGGVLGELGPAGDAAQAAIDVGLTASDMRVGKKAKLKTKVPDEDDLFETLRRTGKFIDRYGI